MTHASLFSGIGGFDLAASWMGWNNVFTCEINEFCNTVLKYHFPDAEQFADVRSTDFTQFRGRIDVLTGGFPCQPFSTAGKRKGTEDDRYLWPEMLRAVREIKPAWIVGENVFGIVSWNGGMVFEQVQTDLETEGYEVQPFILPACGVNAPHKRYRVWFVAHSNSFRQNRSECEHEVEPNERWFDAQHDVEHDGFGRIDTDTSNKRLERRENIGIAGGIRKERKEQPSRLFRPDWKNFPTQSPICTGNDGLPFGMDGITFSKWRNESIKAYGNAIVPQVALQIFKAIQKYNDINE